MPARHCRTCDENWPQSFEFNKCPRCDAQTQYDHHGASVYTRDEAMAVKDGPPLPPPDLTPDYDTSPANMNRIEQYVLLGFDYEDAITLAAARRPYRDSKGKLWQPPLNHVDVAKALAAGCTHALAMEVFA